MKSDDDVLQETVIEEPAIAEEKVKKPKRARKAKVEAAEAAEGQQSDFHTGLNGDKDTPAAPDKETKVKRGAAKKANGGGRAKKASAGAAKAKTRTKRASNGKMNPEATVTRVKGVDNPYRAGSGGHERVELVWKNSGKTVGAIKNLKDIKPTTLNNMLKAGLVKIA